MGQGRTWAAAILTAVLGLALRAPAAGQGTAPLPVAPELAQADALLRQGKPDQALSALQALAAKQPDLPGLAARLGKIYYQKRQFEPAVENLRKAIQENPRDVESTQLLGLTYYLMGHLPEAIPLLERVQPDLPKSNVDGDYILGLSYLQMGNLDKARVAFARTYGLSPDSAGAHLVLAKMMMRQQFEERASGELEKALQLDANLPMAHFILGEIYLFKSDVPRALEEFEKELALNPLGWYVYEGMGEAYVRTQKWDDAERTLKQAIWINPDFSGPYILLGKVELQKGSPDLAVGFLERALRMDPNNYTAHYLLGTAYKQLGREDDSRRELELSQKLHMPKLTDPQKP